MTLTFDPRTPKSTHSVRPHSFQVVLRHCVHNNRMGRHVDGQAKEAPKVFYGEESLKMKSQAWIWHVVGREGERGRRWRVERRRRRDELPEEMYFCTQGQAKQRATHSHSLCIKHISRTNWVTIINTRCVLFTDETQRFMTALRLLWKWLHAE